MNPSLSRMDTLLAGNYRIVAYRDLALPYQLAIGHYMTIDGEAWSEALPDGAFWLTRAQQKRELTKCLPRLIELFGHVPFGVALLPSEAVRHAIMQMKEVAEDFPNWEAYHAWCINSGDIPDHGKDDRWPVVLSDFEDELLQDGWHRVHCYLCRGDETIPAVFYPREHHLAGQF
jgi:hypothetical protein